MYPNLVRTAASLASIVGLRMFGLFLVLPVLAAYATAIDGATPGTIGLALGAYGATQALFQIPLGRLSDRVGRKPVIAGGLAVFALGSVIAALSDSIWGIVLGRALQGSGAIAAAVLALAADLTPPDRRQRVMAAIGISVGLAFLLAVSSGPAIAARFGLPGLFWLTALLALAAATCLIWLPSAPVRHGSRPGSGNLRQALRHADLWRLNAAIASLNFALTCFFLVVPVRLVDRLGLPLADHWQIYLPVLLLTIPVLGVAIRSGERGQPARAGVALPLLAVISAVGVIALAGNSGWTLAPAIWLFFSGFNLLEANLPAYTSRYAPEDLRGAALGAFATFQFGGAFLGGLIGGVVLEHQGAAPALALSAGLLTVAMLVALQLRPMPDR